MAQTSSPHNNYQTPSPYLNPISTSNNNNKSFHIENLLKSSNNFHNEHMQQHHHHQQQQQLQHQQRKQRKARTAFTDHQLKELEASFDINKYVTVQQRVELAARLGLSDTQVKTWYQNRRTKLKRQNAVGLELLNEANYLSAYQSVLQQSQNAQYLLSQCGNQGAQFAAAAAAAAAFAQAVSASSVASNHINHNMNTTPPTTTSANINHYHTQQPPLINPTLTIPATTTASNGSSIDGSALNINTYE